MTSETKWREVPCPCGMGTIPGSLYEAGKRTCGNEPKGARVRFVATTTGEDGMGRPFDIPAGTPGRIIHRINDSAFYVKTLGRSTVVWASEIEATKVATAKAIEPADVCPSCGADMDERAELAPCGACGADNTDEAGER